jgi:hypothetical protein
MREAFLTIFLLGLISAYSQEINDLDSLVGKTIRIIDVDQIHVRDPDWHFVSYRAETEVEEGQWRVIDKTTRDGILYFKIERKNYSYWIHLDSEARWELAINQFK